MELALRGTSPASALVSVAREAALRAIELDPEMIESYSCLGSAQALEWDWESAEKSFLHGQALGPHVGAARRFAVFLAILGRDDEASYHLDAAQHIDPFSNRQKVARARFLHITRRFEEGLRQLSEPFLYGPLPVEARFLLALMSAHVGNKEQAKHLIESIRPASGGQLPMMAGIAEVLALSGEVEEAHKIVRDFKLLSLDSPISRFRQALLSLALDDDQSALSFLTLALEDREPELIWIGVDPRLDPIRRETAFEDIARKVFPGPGN
jgi:tetratricopeptide (TPR) repeat protein